MPSFPALAHVAVTVTDLERMGHRSPVRLHQNVVDQPGFDIHVGRLVERMALALQGSLVLRFGDEAVADAFVASRLAGDWGQAFGTLPVCR